MENAQRETYSSRSRTRCLLHYQREPEHINLHAKLKEIYLSYF
uniref:Uncharacterized protein n=1 Tax=Anguilla anguilla TaxID=7936 RepID=A0A0E9PN97_ANGAN